MSARDGLTEAERAVWDGLIAGARIALARPTLGHRKALARLARPAFRIRVPAPRGEGVQRLFRDLCRAAASAPDWPIAERDAELANLGALADRCAPFLDASDIGRGLTARYGAFD